MVIVLVIMALTIFPRLQAMESAREYRDFRLGLRRIAVDARERAVSRSVTTAITFDDAESAFNVVVEGAEEETIASSLAVPERVSVTSFASEGAESSASEWRLRFYPDGRSDGGGVQLEAGEDLFYLAADKFGIVTFADDEMPDAASQRWPAGEYEHRT